MPHSNTAVAATPWPRRAATPATVRQPPPREDAIQLVDGAQRTMTLRQLLGAMSRMVLGLFVLAFVVSLLLLPQSGNEGFEWVWPAMWLSILGALSWAALVGAIEMPDEMPPKRGR